MHGTTDARSCDSGWEGLRRGLAGARSEFGVGVSLLAQGGGWKALRGALRGFGWFGGTAVVILGRRVVAQASAHEERRT